MLDNNEGDFISQLSPDEDEIIGHRGEKKGAISPLLIQGAIFLGDTLRNMSDWEFKDGISNIAKLTGSFLGRLRFNAFLRTEMEGEENENRQWEPLSKRIGKTRTPEIIRIREGVIVEPEDPLNPRGLIAISFVGDAQRELRETLSFPDVPSSLREELETFQDRLLKVIIYWLNGEKDRATEEYDDIRYEIGRINDAATVLIGEQGLDRWVPSVIRMEAFWENAVLSLRNSQHPFKKQNWDTWRLSFKARDSLAAFEKGWTSELERAQTEDSDVTSPSGYPLNFISAEMKGKINTLFSSVEEAIKALQKENSIEAVLEMALLTEKFLTVSRNIMRLNLGRGLFSFREGWEHLPLEALYGDLLATLNAESVGISASEVVAQPAETVEASSSEETDKLDENVETLVKEARKEIKSAKEAGKSDQEIMGIYEKYIGQIQDHLDQMVKPFSSYMAVQSIGLLKLSLQELGKDDFDSPEALNREDIMNVALALKTVAESGKKPDIPSFNAAEFATLTTALQTLIPSLPVESLVYAKGGDWAEVENQVQSSRVDWIFSEATLDEVFFYGIKDLGEACVLTVKVNDESKPGVAESKITSWDFQTYTSKSDMPEETRLKIKRIMQNEEVREALRARIKETSLASDLGLIVTVGSLVDGESKEVPLSDGVRKGLIELKTQVENAATHSMCQDGSPIKVEEFVDTLSSLYDAISEVNNQDSSGNPPERENPDELARWYIDKISRYLREQLGN